MNSMEKTLCLLMLAFAVLPAGADVPDPPATELPLAIVNEEPILPGEVERQLARMHDSVGQVDRSGFDMDRLIFRLVNDVLIGQEARSAGMAEDPEILEELAEYRDELIFKYLEKEEIASNVEPEDEAVKRLFHEQYNEMQIRVITSDDEAGAAEILAELGRGADMETLARERSVDNISSRGGLMKPAPRVKLPRSVADVAAGLEVGEIGGPVQTDLGWTVFRLEARTPADPARFDELEDGLKRMLRGDKARALRRALARTAEEHHPVVFDQERIAALKPVRQKDDRLVAKPSDPDAVVARVGRHRSVKAGPYAVALNQRWKGIRTEQAAAAAAPIILGELVERELLIAEGERRGYGDLPKLRSLLRSKETQLLVPRYLGEVVAANIEIDAGEIRAYYDEHKNLFLQPPRVRIGQVTVPTPEQAEKVAKMLRGGADLAWVAQQHSTDAFKALGGLRDWIVLSPGADPLHDRLLEAAAGDVVDPFAVAGEYRVVKLVAREEQGPYPFDRVSGNVRQMLFDEKARAALDGYISKLRERSEIVLFDDRIRAMSISGSVVKTEEEGAPGGHGH
jgi:parvulin-like peptidyl-prolyl isomerase